MQANPDKFQAIGKCTITKNPIIELENVNIECEEVVTLLGVDIDNTLTFNVHINNICKKSNRQINVLKRIGKRLSKLNRLTIFHSFVLSNFNFCPLTWHFCSETNTKKIEKIQERALRFVYDDFQSTYKELWERENLPTLRVRRMRNFATETFKIIHDMSPPLLSNLHDHVTKKICLIDLDTQTCLKFQKNSKIW